MAEDAKPEFRSMMRYLPDKKAFEYKADENASGSVKIPEENIGDLRKQIAGSDQNMAKLLDFLVENARKDPDKWVEATTMSVSKDQALV